MTFSFTVRKRVEQMIKNQQTIGSLVSELLIANPSMATKEILAKVLEKFPSAATSEKCIAWYKNDLRKKGLLPEFERKSMTSDERRIARNEASRRCREKKLAGQPLNRGLMLCEDNEVEAYRRLPCSE